jgi:hypothetical protein
MWIPAIYTEKTKQVQNQNLDDMWLCHEIYDFFFIFYFFLFRDQQSEYWVFYELMCWLANCRGEVLSGEEISVVDSIIFLLIYGSS